MQFGMAAATSTAQAGAHYFDSTGERNFVRRVAGLDAVAAERGATMVPAFGYGYVAGDLAGALALDRAGEDARRIEVGYFLTRSGRGDEVRYRRPRLVDERAAKRVLAFHYAGIKRTAMTVGSSEHLGLPAAFPRLDSAEVGLGWLGRWTRPVQLAATLLKSA